MTRVAIMPEPTAVGDVAYRAIAGAWQSVGRTAGEALDGLTALLPEDEQSPLVVLVNGRPDRFFTAQQQRRLGELMARWRAARDAGLSLVPAEQVELDALVDAELRASAARSKAIADELNL